MSKFKHLCIEEREYIYAMKLQGKSFRFIAERLGRDHKTISREYKVNKLPQNEYTPCKAQEYSDKRKTEQRTKAPLKNPEVFLYVRQHLVKDKWTPEQIAGRLSIDYPNLSISHETIYQYIYGKGKKYKLWEHLPNRKKRRTHKHGRSSKKEKHTRIPNTISIEKRPTKANNRSQIGHLETDIMEGPRSSKTALDVTTERKTRYTKISKLQNKKSETKQKVLTNTIKTLQSLQKSNRPVARSITSDNGVENYNNKYTTDETQVTWYVTHAYSSYEKGTVERTIKEVRRYIPKGQNINNYNKQQIQYIENLLNNRPMKCLNWVTPNEALKQEVNTYKFNRYQNTLKCSGEIQG